MSVRKVGFTFELVGSAQLPDPSGLCFDAYAEASLGEHGWRCIVDPMPAHTLPALLALVQLNLNLCLERGFTITPQCSCVWYFDERQVRVPMRARLVVPAVPPPLSPLALEVARDLATLAFTCTPNATTWRTLDADARWVHDPLCVQHMLTLVEELFDDYERVLSWPVERLEAAHALQPWCHFALGRVPEELGCQL